MLRQEMNANGDGSDFTDCAGLMSMLAVNQGTGINN
jgi:hypothetical protein